MWVWYLGEPDDAGNFKCDIAIKKRNVREEDSELKYSGRVHSIRIPPHRSCSPDSCTNSVTLNLRIFPTKMNVNKNRYRDKFSLVKNS